MAYAGNSNKARASVNWTDADQEAWERKVAESDAKHFKDTILANKEAGKVLKEEAARQDLKAALKILNDHGIDVIENIRAANDALDAMQLRITELEAENAALKACKTE